MPARRAEWFRSAQISVLILLGVGAIGSLLHGALVSPTMPVLLPRLSGESAPWISVPIPFSIWLKEIDRTQPPATIFTRPFSVDAPPAGMTIHVRAMRTLELELNGSMLPLGDADPGDWKRARVIDATAFVKPGENLLRAVVRNDVGPALLQLRVDGLRESLQTDASWYATTEPERAGAAQIASDDARYDPGAPIGLSLPGMRPHAGALRTHARLLAGLTGIGAALFLGLRRRSGLVRHAPTIALGLVTGFWVWFFAAKVVAIPPAHGFDAASHQRVVHRMADEARFPRVDEEFVAYHPPLYHVLSALLVRVAKPEPASSFDRAILSLLPALSGLGMAFVAAAMARALVPGSRWIEAGAALAAGLLPMNLTLAAYPSNEAPHAVLASLVLLVTVQALVSTRVRRAHDVMLGLLLSAAVLTKYTSVALIPVTISALALRRSLADDRSLRDIAIGGAMTLATVAALAGWFYAGHWIDFGDPFVWNLNVTPGKTWWQYPGFRTPGYYLRFGDALTDPWFAGFRSFWDSVYTTFWGDGMLGGRISMLGAHHLFRYDWMGVGYVLALPATALLALGWCRSLRDALDVAAPIGPRIALSMLVALPALLLASLVGVTLRIPIWSMPKAFYALFLTPTFALIAVLGFDALDGWMARCAPLALRALPWGWALALFVSFALAYGG